MKMDAMRHYLISSIPKVWKDGPEDSQIGTWLSGVDVDRVSVRSRVYGRFASGNCDAIETLILHGLFS